jgi:hypothetical protein
MNCPTFENLLQHRLDGLEPAGAEQAEFEQHLRACPSCAALAVAARRMTDGLRLLTPPAPPAGLSDRLVAAALADRRRRRLRRAAALVLVAAAAAGVLLALGLASLPGPAPTTPGPDGPNVSGKTQGSPANAEAAPVSPAAERLLVALRRDLQRGEDLALLLLGKMPAKAGPERPMSLRESVDTAGDAFASLTTRTAGETVEQTRLLLPVMVGPGLEPPGLPALEPPTRNLNDAGRGVSAGLEPVSGSARRAVDVFLRDLPPMDLNENPGP